MDKYDKVRPGFLGKGTYGVVEKYARKTDGQVFACKTIWFRDEEHHRDPALQEYNILSKLKHPNIVSYVDIVWEDSSAQIFMNLCEGGSLADFIDSRRKSGGDAISERYISSIFSQLASALLYCHHGITIRPDGTTSGSFFDWNPILHRDIKPGNILLSTKSETEDVVAKLGDFGLSTFVDFEQAHSTYAGTKEYLAPEISRSTRARNRWTKMCDVFSLGCSVYELGNLAAPFTGHMDDDDTYKDLPDIYSAKLNRRVAACMSFSPDQRPDASDLLRSLRRYQQEMGFRVESREMLSPELMPPSEQPPRSPDVPLNNENSDERLSTRPRPKTLDSLVAAPPTMDATSSRRDAENLESSFRSRSVTDFIQLDSKWIAKPTTRKPELQSLNPYRNITSTAPDPGRQKSRSRSRETQPLTQLPTRASSVPSSLMTLKIKNSTGIPFSVSVDAKCSVMEIKNKIEEQEGIPWDRQMLIFGGKFLNNNQLAGSCGIRDGSVLTIVLSSRTDSEVGERTPLGDVPTRKPAAAIQPPAYPTPHPELQDQPLLENTSAIVQRVRSPNSRTRTDFKINVESPTGSLIPVDVYNSTTILDIKEGHLWSIPPERLQLSYGELKLRDEFTIEYCGIRPGETLRLNVLRP